MRRVFVVVEGWAGRGGAETPGAEKRTSVGRDAEHELWEESERRFSRQVEKTE